MLDGVPYLQASIQFGFYVAAFVCFVAAALLPKGSSARWGTGNLVSLGLALAIAPWCYIYFKVAFHTGSFFH